MGTSFEDTRAHGIVWTRVYFNYIWAFLMCAPLSTDVPVLLLNQPNSYLCTEFVNEMNSKKKASLCFQRFMSGFYQINVAVSHPTEFNLEQNLAIHRESFAFSAGSNFNCNVHQYSLDGNISAESFPFLPEIFFVKDCIEEKLHVLWPR